MTRKWNTCIHLSRLCSKKRHIIERTVRQHASLLDSCQTRYPTIDGASRAFGTEVRDSFVMDGLKRRRRTRVLSWSLLLAALGLAVRWADAAAGPSALRVEWKQHRLTVVAKGVPLVEVLTEIARATGAEVEGAKGLQRRVDAQYSELTLEDAFARLLAGVSFATMESAADGDNWKHLTVVILGASGPLLARTSAEEKKPPLAPAEAALAELQARKEHGDWDALRRAASNGDPITQDAALRLLAQHDRKSAATLAAAAARSSDPGHKIVGIQALGDFDSAVGAKALGAALNDPDTGVRQSAVMGLMGQTSPETTGFLARALEDREYTIRMTALDLLAQRGEDGEAALYSASMHSADPIVRSRATELLEQLR